MRYLGGKSRIAKPISNIINNNLTDDTPFVSLFCGSCIIENLTLFKNFDIFNKLLLEVKV